MTVLSPSGLEQIDYNQPQWHTLFNANMRLLDTLMSISALLDIDLTSLEHGSYLVWNSSTSKWEVAHR